MKKEKAKLHVFKTIDELAKAAADDFVARMKKAVKFRGSFYVALSGGHTPQKLFEILAKDAPLGVRNQIDWRAVKIFWGDERYVSHQNDQSNYFAARRDLLKHVAIPHQNIFPIPTGDKDPRKAAERYAKTIKSAFHLGSTDVPVFDLVYLGMGDDGHTASIFPDEEYTRRFVASEYKQDFVVSANIKKLGMTRISLTPAIFNHARAVNFLIAGESKAQILKSVLEGPEDPSHLPSQLIDPVDGELSLFLDEAAASLITRP